MFNRLFNRQVPRYNQLVQLEEMNKRLLGDLREGIIERLGYPVSNRVIIAVAVKRLLECYTVDEIISVLQYYKLVKK